MPDISRGLGSAGDFGHNANEPIVSDGENAWTDGPPQGQGNIRRIEDEVAAINQEILGPADDPVGELEGDFEDPFEGAEVGEYLTEPSAADLMAYLEAMKPEYIVGPMELCALKNEGLISVAEARAYLAGKGVIGG